VPAPVSTSAYRLPGETLILVVTIAAVLGIIAVTATATLCGSLVFVVIVLLISFSATRSHHQTLLRRAQAVTPASAPALSQEVEICRRRLQPGEAQVFVLPSGSLNAYTFGLSTPKVVVLYSALLQVMSPGELRFIIGHELGHIRLGHTWLNSLIGGMAGIPSSLFINTLLAVVFRGWNRSCEYSADRAGLLACGDIEDAVGAMVKLVAPDRELSPEARQHILRPLDAEDEDPASLLGELFSTHPLLIRRIERLQQYAASPTYRRLQALVDGNLE
jgi:Zn-dependent protease with chaperone function